MLTVKVTAGLSEGHLTGAAEVSGGGVVGAAAAAEGEDNVDATPSAVT